MSPKPKRKLKPLFKPRPRKRATTVQGAAAPGPAAAPSPGSVADPAALGRRREQLARQYAELQSDLGGLVYEMAIRDHFRLDVVTRQAAKLQAVDVELTAVERGLQGAAAQGPSCRACGAALQPGAAFCAQCGTAQAAPLATATSQPSLAPAPAAPAPPPPAGPMPAPAPAGPLEAAAQHTAGPLEVAAQPTERTPASPPAEGAPK